MLIKHFIAEKANNYDSTENSRTIVRILYRTLGLWFGIGILLSYITYEYGLDSRHCSLCNQLANTFPSIDIAAAKSDYPNVMRIIWLYLTVTTPLSFLGFTLAIPYFEYTKPNPGFLGIIFLIVVFGAMVFGGIYSFLNGGPDLVGRLTRWDKWFIHSILGGFIFSFSQFFLASIGLFFLVSLPIMLIRNR